MIAPSIEDIRERLMINIAPMPPMPISETQVDDDIVKWVNLLTDPDGDIDEKLLELQNMKPGVGTIVRVPSFRHLDLGDAPERIACPVNILLDSEVDVFKPKTVWRGWIVTRDIQYANHFDLVRIGDSFYCEDGCNIIQCWNQVYVYEGCIHEVIGQVSSTKLAAARQLDADFLKGTVPTESDVGRFGKAGDLIYRQISGSWQQTGCWLDWNADDVRKEYVNIYSDFSEYINASVKKALPAISATPNLTTSILKLFGDVRTRISDALTIYSDTISSIFTSPKIAAEPGALHAAGGAKEIRFDYMYGEYLTVRIDYEKKIAWIDPAFDSGGKNYKLFFIDEAKNIIAQVPRESDGFLGTNQFGREFEQHLPEIHEGLDIEIREVINEKSSGLS